MCNVFGVVRCPPFKGRVRVEALELVNIFVDITDMMDISHMYYHHLVEPNN